MIDNLYNLFTAEIRQIVINNKIKVICTEKKFIEIITYHDIKIFKKKKLKITDKIFKTMIKNILTQIKKNLIIL